MRATPGTAASNSIPRSATASARGCARRSARSAPMSPTVSASASFAFTSRWASTSEMRRALFVGVALAAVLVVAVAAALAWLLGTEEGLRLVLERATRATQGQLVVEEPRGALAG